MQEDQTNPSPEQLSEIGVSQNDLKTPAQIEQEKPKEVELASETKPLDPDKSREKIEEAEHRGEETSRFIEENYPGLAAIRSLPGIESVHFELDGDRVIVSLQNQDFSGAYRLRPISREDFPESVAELGEYFTTEGYLEAEEMIITSITNPEVSVDLVHAMGYSTLS